MRFILRKIDLWCMRFVFKYVPTKWHFLIQYLRANTYAAERTKMYEVALWWLRLNKVQGDVFEFGTFNGDSFLQMYFFAKKLLPKSPHFFLFDSFEGLPEPKGRDQHEQWQKGQYSFSIEQAIKKFNSFKVNPKDYTTIKGFYEQTLTGSLKQKIATKLSLLHIDCDFFESTKTAFDFCKTFLQEGTVILFDDYYLYTGSPTKGERGAFNEFLSTNPQVKVTPWFDYSLHGKAFIVNEF